MRINKFLSTLGIASRRAIDKYIEEGRITVNYNIAIPGMDINENDDIFIDGKRIETKINDNFKKMSLLKNFAIRDIIDYKDEEQFRMACKDMGSKRPENK